MTQHDGESGFSLVEVLVGFVILSLALATLFRAVSISFDGLRLSRERELFVAHGSSLLELAQTSGLSNMKTSGIYANGSDWRLRLVPIVLDPNQGAPSFGSVWVIFEVRFAGKTQLELRTLRYR